MTTLVHNHNKGEDCIPCYTAMGMYQCHWCKKWSFKENWGPGWVRCPLCKELAASIAEQQQDPTDIGNEQVAGYMLKLREALIALCERVRSDYHCCDGLVHTTKHGISAKHDDACPYVAGCNLVGLNP